MPLTLKRTSPTTSITSNSVLFDGTNDYLSLSRVLDNSTDVTIECWVYVTSTPPANAAYVFAQYVQPPAGTDRTIFGIGSDLKTFIQLGATSVASTAAITLNTWYHLAVVRSGAGANNFSIYINGVRDGQMTYTGTFQNTPTTIGATNNLGSTYFPGYISNLRVLKGTALYTGASFTVPTSPLTAIANTALLTCNAPTIVDASTNNFTITNNNGATVSSTSPFVAATNTFQFTRRTSTPVGKSVQFNGSNQYLSIANNAAFNFGTGNFTVECWFYATANVSSQQCLITNYGGPSAGWAIQIASGVINANLSGDGFDIFGGSPAINTWYHVGLSGAQGSIKLFLNGVQIGSTYTGAVSMDTSAATTIGNIANSGHMTGYISNARVVKGTALYTGASFTVPTSPLTAIANTSLLTCNAATIVDGSSNNFTITNNNGATVSSTSPFVIVSDNNFLLKKVFADPTFGTQKAIFGYGDNGVGSVVSTTNLVSNTGVVSINTTGVGTARANIAASGYGTDKAIFGYGTTTTYVSMTNLVSNTGVVAIDTAGVGTGRQQLAASGYGIDKAIFGYGYTTTYVSMTNLVSNTGIVASDTTGVGTSRRTLAATGYGSDKAIFGYGTTGTVTAITNLVSNTGVVSTDTAGVGTARQNLAAAGYGSDKAIFGYGSGGGVVSMTNLVSNTGIVSNDITGVGSARNNLAAASYGTDKAIFGYGYTTGQTSITNLVSNTGVVATDTAGVGTARYALAAAGFSLT